MVSGTSDQGSSDGRPALKDQRLSNEDVGRESSTSIQAESMSGLALSNVDIQSPSTLLHHNLRKRKSSVLLSNPLDEAMKPLTEEEKRNWKGWVELESEPVSRDEYMLFTAETSCVGSFQLHTQVVWS